MPNLCVTRQFFKRLAAPGLPARASNIAVLRESAGIWT